MPALERVCIGSMVAVGAVRMKAMATDVRMTGGADGEADGGEVAGLTDGEGEAWGDA